MFDRGRADLQTHNLRVAARDGRSYVGRTAWYFAKTPAANATRGSDLEVGAFVVGPELSRSDPPRLPVSGTASDSGFGGGVYKAFTAASNSGSGSDTDTVGGFSGDAALTADFSSGSVEGCFGCNGGVTTWGMDYHSGRSFPFDDELHQAEIRFGRTAIDRSTATFRGTSVSLHSTDALVAFQSSGFGPVNSPAAPVAAGMHAWSPGRFTANASFGGDEFVKFIGTFGAGR